MGNEYAPNPPDWQESQAGTQAGWQAGAQTGWHTWATGWAVGFFRKQLRHDPQPEVLTHNATTANKTTALFMILVPWRDPPFRQPGDGDAGNAGSAWGGILAWFRAIQPCAPGGV